MNSPSLECCSLEQNGATLGSLMIKLSEYKFVVSFRTDTHLSMFGVNVQFVPLSHVAKLP